MNTVGFWSRFQIYFVWGLEAWMLPQVLIVGLALLVSVVAALLAQPQIKTRWRRSHWLVFTQLLFYPLIVAVGAAFPAGTSVAPGGAHSVPLGERLLDMLTFAPLITGSYWVHRMRGLRWLAGSLVLLQEVVLYGALFVAGMSLSGDWL